MTDPNDILELAERNHRTLHTLARSLGVEDELTDDVTPRGDLSPDEKAKYFGFDAGEKSKWAVADDDERAAGLIIQNSENLQRLASAVGADDDVSTRGASAGEKAAFFGTK